jgi:ubiquinone/menaquinone biosynthesis C-methylase UbiE
MTEIPTRFVRAIFTDVEREYDALLHLMTFSFDWVWRRRMFAKMDFPRKVMVLDLAGGTGLVTFELSRVVRQGRVDCGAGSESCDAGYRQPKKAHASGRM